MRYSTTPAVKREALEIVEEGSWPAKAWVKLNCHTWKQSVRRVSMRFLMRVSWDVEAGNAVVRAGKLGQIIQSILAEQKPEAVYFTAEGGQRGGIIVVNISDVSQIPALAEPWFLTANAKVEFIPAMTPEDLAKAAPNIEAAVKKYA
jgi:hypothetical protein